MDKNIFFYWGNPKLSWLRYMTLKSFRKFHPDWKMYLYVEKIDKDYGSPPWSTRHKQDFHYYTGAENYLDQVEDLDITILSWMDEEIKHIKKISPSQRSNFFKWKILIEKSGFFSDMDILYFKSLDKLRDELITQKYDTAITHNGRYFSIGFLGSKGNSNQVFQGIFNNCVSVFKPAHYQGAGVWSLYQRWGKKDKSTSLTDMKREFPNNKIGNIRMNYFYHLNHLPDIFEQDCSKELFEKGMALHWYAGGDLAQNYNNRINKDNYMYENNTISKILKYIEDIC